MKRFKDQVVLITGSGSGIGRGITKAFHKEGAITIPTDVDPKGLAETVQLMTKGKDIPVTSFKMDVTNLEEIEHIVTSVIDKYGRIDVLINNAGVSTTCPIVEMPVKDWDFIFNVNIRGMFLVTRTVLPHMIAANKGKIVNTASAAGKDGQAYQAHYAASKFAVLGFTQGLAKEVAQNHINVNAVCPGAIKTPMQDREVVWEGEIRGMDPETLRQMMVMYTPLGRLGYPEDVAKVVLFLASPDADFMTGQGVNVTGGITMH